MEVKDLVLWVYRAQTTHELSWDDKKSKYKFTREQGIEIQKPIGATEIESEIAEILIQNCWNEIQHWVERID